MAFQKLTLGKPWLEFDAGAEVEVDAERLAWLLENGYGQEARPTEPEKPARKRRQPKEEEE